MSVNKKLQQILLQRKENNSLRSLSFTRHLIDFSSNDYLSFARDEDHKHKIIQRFLGKARTRKSLNWTQNNIFVKKNV